jgi:predicted MFS family arabinose efflux permease
MELARSPLGRVFAVSGFCALLYQTVWMRLAFAHFGVVTPVVSIVISVFMLGLGAGSWLAGQYAESLCKRFRLSGLTLYGLIEAAIAAGAFIVPALFHYLPNVLLQTGDSNSAIYLAGSGLAIFLSMFPFALAMGMTYPTMLFAIKQMGCHDDNSFGYFYAFNTIGAILGVAVTVFILIEALGFSGVLVMGATLNLCLAAFTIAWGRGQKKKFASTCSCAAER